MKKYKKNIQQQRQHQQKTRTIVLVIPGKAAA